MPGVVETGSGPSHRSYRTCRAALAVAGIRQQALGLCPTYRPGAHAGRQNSACLTFCMPHMCAALSPVAVPGRCQMDGPPPRRHSALLGSSGVLPSAFACACACACSLTCAHPPHPTPHLPKAHLAESRKSGFGWELCVVTCAVYTEQRRGNHLVPRLPCRLKRNSRPCFILLVARPRHHHAAVVRRGRLRLP